MKGVVDVIWKWIFDVDKYVENVEKFAISVKIKATRMSPCDKKRDKNVIRGGEI